MRTWGVAKPAAVVVGALLILPTAASAASASYFTPGPSMPQSVLRWQSMAPRADGTALIYGGSENDCADHRREVELLGGQASEVQFHECETVLAKPAVQVHALGWS